MIKFINIWDDKSSVFVKTKEGITEVKEYPWYFCITLKDAKEHRDFMIELKRKEIVKNYKNDGEYVRVFTPYMDRDTAIHYMKSKKIQTFEDDLKPFQRFLVDEEVELDTEMSVLYFDIETSDLKKGINPGEEMILSIAAIGSDGERYFMTHTDDETSKGEISMLKKFVKLVDKYEIISGWNSEGFDLVAISKRCKMFGIEFSCWVNERTAQDLGGLDNVRRSGKYRARPMQFNHIDLMQKMKEMHYRDTELIKKVRSFSLSAVSQVILGEDKVDLDGKSMHYLWKNEPGLLMEYNFQDVQLLVKLDAKLNITKQKIIEHQVCCARINDYTSHGKIDVFGLRGAKKLGKRLPSKPDKEEFEEDYEALDSTAEVDPGNKSLKAKGDYQGGYVFEPVTGLHKNVYIFDFQSLYPSIIKTFNVSIDSYVGYWPPENARDPNHIIMPTGARFKRDSVGIIPSIIQDVLDQRNNIRHNIMKKLEKNSPEYMNWHYRQYAFKVLANSMYGIMGASFSRYFKREIAEGITLTGQDIIKHMWTWLEQRGFKPIYGDTDSLFLTHPDKVDTDKLVADIKVELDEYLVKSFNVPKNQIIMDFKGMYPKFIAADKKKYVGITEDGEIEMTGLEAKKRDTLPKAEQWQRELLDALLKNDYDLNYYIQWVKQRRDFITHRMLTLDEITFQKRLSKEIEDYGKIGKSGKPTPIPVHVKVAAYLKENEKAGDSNINLYSQGSYIAYFVVESKKGIKALHPLQFKGDYDLDYYMNACLEPSLRVLRVVYPKYDWDASKSLQMTLF